MSSGAQTGLALEIDRWLDASPERVFEAFTNEDQLRQWWGPRDFESVAISFRPRVGGRYRVELAGPDGSRFAHVGTFRAVEPPRHLSYTWRWVAGPLQQSEMLVAIDFEPERGGTRVRVRHAGFVDESSRDAHTGWPESFDRLVPWLELGRPVGVAGSPA